MVVSMSASYAVNENQCESIIVINELNTKNTSIKSDDDGDYNGWLELYNCSDKTVNMNGWRLLKKNINGPAFKFKDVEIEPRLHLLIWLSGKNKQITGMPLHANFTLKNNESAIILKDEKGKIVDDVKRVAIPRNKSFGRKADGLNKFIIFDNPTPSEKNIINSENVSLEPPVFSRTSGFYDESFVLKISHQDPEIKIYYTFDGSLPDPKNLKGSTYKYKNIYPRNPGDPIGEFLENTYKTHIYKKPLKIKNRTEEPDRLSRISTSYHNQSPGYFPTKIEESKLKGFLNSGIEYLNKVIDVAQRVVTNILGRTQNFVNVDSVILLIDKVPRIDLIEPKFVPDTVYKGVSVRAIAVRDDDVTSEVVTHNFFIGSKDDFSLPVVSITVPEKYLFDFDAGIMVAGKNFEEWREKNPSPQASHTSDANWFKRGHDVVANLQLFDDNLVIDQNVGIRVHGGATRLNLQKSLRIYARNKYDQNAFNHSIFRDREFGNYKRLILRNSGNDADKTLFRDAAVHRIFENLPFATQSYRPAVVFINAEYYGILNFRERYDRFYFDQYYNINRENIDLLSLKGVVKHGDNVEWIKIFNFIKNNDIKNKRAYDKILNSIDVDNFIDYNIANIFINNVDWPHNNIAYWRYRTDGEHRIKHPKDGRWRWLMYDTDLSFGVHVNFAANGFEMLSLDKRLNQYDSGGPIVLFSNLLLNNDFKIAFINRFADLLNTDLKSDRMIDIIHEMKSTLEPEISRHIHRWSYPKSVDMWQKHVDVMVDFAKNRPGVQRQHIMNYFNLGADYEVAVSVSSPSHGHVKLNSIAIKDYMMEVNGDEHIWRGNYFRGVPIRLEAIANPGYVFSHWSGLDENLPVFRISPSQNLKIKAIFVPDSKS